MPQPVVLPPKGDGSRRRTRPEAPPRRPRRSVRFPPLPRPSSRLLAVVLALVVAVSAAFVVLPNGGDGDEEGPDGALAPAISADRSRTAALVVVRGEGNRLDGLTLLIAREDGGGDVVYVPTGTMTEVPSLGLVPIREAAPSGTELVRQALENVLGRLVDRAVDVTAADLAAAMAPAAPLQLQRLSGSQVVPADQIAGLLGAGPAPELQRIVDHQAVWLAWLRALTARPELVPTSGPLADLGPLLRTLSSKEAVHQTLPVETIATGADGSEYYEVRDAELAEMVQRMLPGDVPLGERMTVRLLNGTGTPGLTQRVQPLLVEAGFRITLTGNADRFDYASTQIVYYDDEGSEAARVARTAIGAGDIVRSVDDSDAVDLTVVIGTDFAERPVGSTTSTSIQGANP